MMVGAVFAVLLFMAITVAVDINTFNTIFDYIVGVYVLASIAVIVLYVRRNRDSEKNDDEEGFKKYVIKKKVDLSNVSPRALFIGKWTKVSRTGFAEVSIVKCHGVCIRNVLHTFMNIVVRCVQRCTVSLYRQYSS